MGIGVGSIYHYSAQNRIDPPLAPASTASGMIILAFNSARILNEKLKSSEWLGIFSLFNGIAFLAFSRLEIPKSQVDLLEPETQIGMAFFPLCDKEPPGSLPFHGLYPIVLLVDIRVKIVPSKMLFVH